MCTTLWRLTYIDIEDGEDGVYVVVAGLSDASKNLIRNASQYAHKLNVSPYERVITA